MLKRQAAATSCSCEDENPDIQAFSSPLMTELEKTSASSLKTEQVEVLVNGILDDVILGAIHTVVQEEINHETETSQTVPVTVPEQMEVEGAQSTQVEEGYSDSQLLDSVKL